MTDKDKELTEKALSSLELPIQYSQRELQAGVEKILTEKKGYETELISEQIQKIKRDSNAIITKSQNKGVFGKLISVFVDKKEQFLAQTQDLKKQIDGLDKILENEVKLIQERIPEMVSFLNGFKQIDTNINEDLKTLEEIKEFLTHKIILTQAKKAKEEKDGVGVVLEYNLEIEELNTQMETAISKEDNLNGLKSYILTLATTMSNHISVAKMTRENLLTVRETVLPLLSYNAVSNVIANELHQALALSQSMKEGVGKVFVETTKLAAENSLKISNMQKDGILDLDAIKRITKIMEEAENKIALNQEEKIKKIEERRIAGKEFEKSLNKIQEQSSARILAAFGHGDREVKEIKEIERKTKQVQEEDQDVLFKKLKTLNQTIAENK